MQRLTCWCRPNQRHTLLAEAALTRGRGVRRLENRYPELKGMGLGGGVNWPFLCSLQRVADVLRALVRP